MVEDAELSAIIPDRSQRHPPPPPPPRAPRGRRYRGWAQGRRRVILALANVTLLYVRMESMGQWVQWGLFAFGNTL